MRSTLKKERFTGRARTLRYPLVLFLLALLASSSSASADLSFGPSGSGAGQTRLPQGIAVDNSNGRVYVADRGNNRIDVFTSTGDFLLAWGWGVADGTSAELQTCTAVCFKGISTGGAGSFGGLESIDVDDDAASPAFHDVYVSEQFRIQKFSPDGEFLAAWGGGVISGGAVGKADLSSGSSTITNVITTKKAFLPGQAIVGSGIPAEAKILAVGDGTITLSKAATASAAGVTISAPEGAGNVPVNEVDVVTITSPHYDPASFFGSTLEFQVRTPAPSPTAENTPTIPANASAAEVQAALAALPNVGAGNVSVTSPNPGGVPGDSGGPYTIEFKGPRFADTNVEQISVPGTGPNRVVSTIQNGHSSAAVCTSASAGICTRGVEGGGDGQLGREQEPVSVGPGGIVDVADQLDIGGGKSVDRIEKFGPLGEFVGQVMLPGTRELNTFVTDSGGNFYVRYGKGIEKLDPSGSPLFTLEVSDVRELAVDSSDNLFVAHIDGPSRVVSEFGPSGTPLRRFGYGIFGFSAAGMAAYHTASGDIYMSEETRDGIKYVSFPPPGPILCCVATKSVGNTKATLEARVNPEGKETKYHFQYVDDKGFEEDGFASAATKATPEQTAGADFSLHVASAVASLVPSTTYHYRLLASNENGEAISEEGEFKSLPPLEVGDTWAAEVGTDAAQLHAEVNPLGIAATAYFQYVDDATYQADVEVSGAGHGFDHATDAPDSATPIDVGSGEAMKRISTFLYPLAAGSTYHYRVIVEDPFFAIEGQEHTLRISAPPSTPTTGCPNQAFRTGASASLPDCRAYEMVSPVDKNGSDIRVNINARNFVSGLDRASGDGERFSYSSSTAFAGAPSGPWTSQYVAIRGGDGWSTQPISPPREPESIFLAINVYTDLQYKLFSDDLSASWLLHDTGPVLDDCAVKGFLNLYRRDEASGEYEALTTAAPSNEAATTYWPELLGASDDGSHTVFKANGKLTKDASASQGYQLYEHVAGKNGCGTLRLVSVLPDGKADVPLPISAQTAEGRGEAVQHRISEDGSRIFWTDRDRRLYVRSNGKQTLPVSAGPAAAFIAASPDGSRVLFDEEEKEGLVDLYEYDVGKAEAHLIAEDAVGGMGGASEDATHIYFASRKSLAGGAEAGKPNLYLHVAGGTTSFIATLAPPDVSSALRGPFNPVTSDPMSRGARTTPGGTHLAFVSKAQLTGYDNKDIVDGQPNLEVYLYDAETAHLACISCNPSGGRPQGRKFVGASSSGRVAAELPSAENQFSFPRALSSDGDKLFFNSYEALVPRDSNGKEDVYEWERAGGAGECEEAGAELYVASSGGCLSLISSGQSPQDSEFDDASPDGSDVFIKTSAGLLPQDDGLIDVYDAREGGGYPPPAATPPACEGEACQGPPSPPNDPTPASSAFEGAGNVVEKPKAKKKAKHKRKQTKRHAGKKHQRANHKRRAGR